MDNVTEELKKSLNYEVRSLLKIIDVIDGKTKEYAGYKENTLSENVFLEQQLLLVNEAKNRLLNIFKN